jgi:hypothetical protein
MKTINVTIKTHKFPTLVDYMRGNVENLKIPPFGIE